VSVTVGVKCEKRRDNAESKISIDSSDHIIEPRCRSIRLFRWLIIINAKRNHQRYRLGQRLGLGKRFWFWVCDRVGHDDRLGNQHFWHEVNRRFH
jgi:hypothetical protein